MKTCPLARVVNSTLSRLLSTKFGPSLGQQKKMSLQCENSENSQEREKLVSLVRRRLVRGQKGSIINEAAVQ